MSATGSGTIRQVADDDEDRQKRDPPHPHQARVGDVSRTLRFDAGDGQNAGHDYCETEPSQPSHIVQSSISPGNHLWSSFFQYVAIAAPVELFTVDFDVFLGAAVGDRDHDAESNQYYYSDYCPCHADAGQNSHFPERSQNTTDEHDITDKIHAGPFHDESPWDYKL